MDNSSTENMDVPMESERTTEGSDSSSNDAGDSNH